MDIASGLFGSPWMPLGVLSALAVYARIIQGTWLHPAAFPALVWSGFIAEALITSPKNDVSGLAVWTILSFTLAAYIGAALAEGHTFRHNIANGFEIESFRPLLGYVCVFSLLGMASVILLAASKLSEYGLSFSFSGLLALGHLVSVDRYAGVQEPAMVRALWTWIFPASVLGGVTFEMAKSRLQKYLSLAAVAPALASAFVETTRASVLIPICCWLGSLFSMKVYHVGDEYRLFNRRTLFVSAMLALVVASVFFGLDAVRVFTPENQFSLDPDYARLKAYSAGSLSVFSNWLIREEASDPVTFGEQTFRSFFELVGLRERRITPELLLREGGYTNVPTAFCELIQDFTFPGALFVCLLTGYAGGRAFRRVKQGDIASEPALAAFYTLVLFSPITSLTNYNGPILAWVLSYFILSSTMRGKRESRIAIEDMGGPSSLA